MVRRGISPLLEVWVLQVLHHCSLAVPRALADAVRSAYQAVAFVARDVPYVL